MTPRGFTLLELVLGASFVLIITSVAMGVMVAVQGVQRDAQIKSSVIRDAQFTLDTVARDLQYVGAGVPRGHELYMPGSDASPPTSALLRPPIRIGRADYLAFVGDLPYPNADVNGAMVLQNVGNTAPPTLDAPDTLHRAHVASELALCTPPDSAPGASYTCRTGIHRLIDVGSTTDCESANALTAATCPWSLGKWRGVNGGMLPAHVVISTPGGGWVRRQIDALDTGFGDAVSAVFNQGYPSETVVAPPRLVPGDLDPRDFVQRRSGSSLIAQLDRVFYSLEQLDGSPCGDNADCVLRRRQCWGWADGLSPDDAAFPNVDAPPIPSDAALTDIGSCAPGREGTGWEPVMHGISRMHLKYYASSNPDVELTPPLSAEDAARVMFIEISVELRRTLPSPTPLGQPTTLQQAFTRRVFMEDAGGAFVDLLPPHIATDPPAVANEIAPARGGCTTELACGRH